MANCLILIYRDEQAATQAGGTDVSAPYRAFMERRAGSLRGGAALEPRARRRRRFGPTAEGTSR